MKRTASIKRFPLLVCAFFLAGLAFLCPGQAAAQATQDYGLPQGFSFWNVLSSDVVEALGRNNDKEWLEYIRRQNYNAEFAGIKEKVCIQYESDKLDFLLAPEFSLSDAGQHWTPYDANWSSINHALNHDDLCFSWTGLEWYLSFMPFDLVEVNLHRNVRTEGGYLPALGRWLDEADLQGDGFGLMLSPLEGLRLAAELPMGFELVGIPNWLNAEAEDAAFTGNVKRVQYGYGDTGGVKFVLNAGADYNIADFVTVGLSVHDLLSTSTRGIGVYAAAQLAFLQLRAGYTYNGEATRVSYLDFDGMGLERVYIGGRHKVSLAASAAQGKWRLSADALWNVQKEQSIYDLYTGLKAEYDLLPGKFSCALAAALMLDFGNEAKGGIGSAVKREKGRADLPMYTTGTYWFHPINGSGDRSGNNRHAEQAAPMLEVAPQITYVTGRNTFRAGATFQYWTDGEDSWAASFPLSWEYRF